MIESLLLLLTITYTISALSILFPHTVISYFLGMFRNCSIYCHNYLNFLLRIHYYHCCYDYLSVSGIFLDSMCFGQTLQAASGHISNFAM